MLTRFEAKMNGASIFGSQGKVVDSHSFFALCISASSFNPKVMKGFWVIADTLLLGQFLECEAAAFPFATADDRAVVQSQVAREVDQNLTSIRELSVQSSTGASQTASACSEMANLAVELNRLVARFKV